MIVCHLSNRPCCRLSALHFLTCPLGKDNLSVPITSVNMFSFFTPLFYNAPPISEMIQSTVIIGGLENEERLFRSHS